jgi:hypothetical protein
MFWEECLRDNLLNFASTAKGILLLQQTGAMNECVTYMYQRYEKKLQVSPLLTNYHRYIFGSSNLFFLGWEIEVPGQSITNHHR